MNLQFVFLVKTVNRFQNHLDFIVPTLDQAMIGRFINDISRDQIT